MQKYSWTANFRYAWCDGDENICRIEQVDAEDMGESLDVPNKGDETLLIVNNSLRLASIEQLLSSGISGILSILGRAWLI
jgi:hypothetical protein